MSSDNGFRTFALLAAMTALFMGAGFLLGGQQGMLIAFVVAVAMNLFSYWGSAGFVRSLYGAHEVDEESHPNLVGIVRQLAQRAQMPMPRVYVIDSAQPNAFATGRSPSDAAVAATTGLLEQLSYEEVAGVMAHELAHVRNRDTLIMTITATLAGAIGLLSNMAGMFGLSGSSDRDRNPVGPLGALIVMILAPIAAVLVQMAISRTREYSADRVGAQICGNPLWLADALRKIERMSERTYIGAAERNPATAHMFIINPLHGASLTGMFRTHPSTDERVRRLTLMAGGADGRAVDRGGFGGGDTTGGAASRGPAAGRPAAGKGRSGQRPWSR